MKSAMGPSRQGRAASKPGYVRYPAESGSKFRAASQLIGGAGLAPRRSPPRRVSGRDGLSLFRLLASEHPENAGGGKSYVFTRTIRMV
jgi:hypothetical protein